MKSIKYNLINKNSNLNRYLLIVPVLLSGLFLTGCVSDPYADDGDYRSSQGEYYGDHHDYDDTYIDEPRARVEVYASSGPYGYRTRYRNPYYARHYSGYYFDPFYGVYYSYGRGSYGPYGSYRSGYGYYCPVHSSYFGHSHYRSHSHRRHHHNVRRYNHNRDYRRHNVRNRNNVIQPNTEGLATTRRGAGNRNSGTSNPRNNRDGSLGQRGLDGQTVTRDNSIDPRDRFIRNNEIRTNTTNNRRRARRVVAPTPDTSANTQGSNRQQSQNLSEQRRRQIAAARAAQGRRATTSSQNNQQQQPRPRRSETRSDRRDTSSNSNSRRSSSERNRSRSNNRSRRSPDSNRSRNTRTQRR